jgi:hypothetical protein
MDRTMSEVGRYIMTRDGNVANVMGDMQFMRLNLAEYPSCFVF